MRSNRRIRQRGKAFNSHTRFPLLTGREECEYLASNSLSTYDNIVILLSSLITANIVEI